MLQKQIVVRIRIDADKILLKKLNIRITDLHIGFILDTELVSGLCVTEAVLPIWVSELTSLQAFYRYLSHNPQAVDKILLSKTILSLQVGGRAR